MPERDGYAHGIPSWVDLATKDVAAAQAFYAGVFGWTYEERPTDDPASPYVMALRNGKIVAGMMQLRPEMEQAGMPPVWSTYVAVDSVDDVVAKVSDAGGTALGPPMDVMDDVGRMAVMSDPTGAVIGVWQAGTHKGAELVNEHGAVIWNELMTSDVDAAAAFYGEIFGWDRQDQDMGGDGMYTTFLAGGDMACGAMPLPMEGIPPHWGVYFAVDDFDAAFSAATAAGAQPMGPTMTMPGVGTMASLTDPGGAGFAMMQPEQTDD